MERIEVISAKHPRHLEGDDETITLDVLFSHLSESVPFTASKNDPEEHGRALYSRAAFGEFGPIDIIPTPLPTLAQQQADMTIRQQHASAMMAPLEDAERLGIISDAERELLTAWQHYRVALYRLPQSEGWPIDVNWPEPPQ